MTSLSWTLTKLDWLFASEGDASGAMRLVADDQVEFGQPMLGLGVGNDRDRLVGREDHTYSAACQMRLYGRGQLVGFRGGRKGQVGDFYLSHVEARFVGAFRPVYRSTRQTPLSAGLLSAHHSGTVCAISARDGTSNRT